MRIVALLISAASVLGAAQAASAQDFFGTTTSFRGLRLEANAGGDRFQSEGNHNDKFGYGATIGFDGQIGDKIVIGPEGTVWRANKWTENNTAGAIGGNIAHKSFEEFGAAVRAGYLFTPNLLAFGKAGWVTNDQRKRFDAPAGETGFYNHTGTDGYQVGGGVEYTLPSFSGVPLPIYVSAQYVYSNYDDHTARQRLMGGIGIRFK